MRQHFIPHPDETPITDDDVIARTKEQAFDLCPWACEVERVEGGWMVFESDDDYRTWLNQL